MPPCVGAGAPGPIASAATGCTFGRVGGGPHPAVTDLSLAARHRFSQTISDRATSGLHSMTRLLTLGTVDLRGGDGHPVEAVLCQPKRLALLAYLAVATPRGFHRRDKLVGLFWPELDNERARGSLNQAVYMLRRALTPSTIVSRGGEAVALREGAVWCDSAAFENALEQARLNEAVELYRGDLLDGFFLPDAAEFERWLDGERARLRGRAAQAGWALAEMHASRGEATQAIERARWAAALMPGDERSLRRQVELMERLGDRAGALRVYDEFAERLRLDYDLDPSAETRARIDAVRSTQQVPARHGAAAPPREATPALAEPDRERAASSPIDGNARSPTLNRYRAIAIAALSIGLAVLTGHALYSSRVSSEGRAVAAAPPTDAASLAVLPFVTIGADSANAYFSSGLTEEIRDAVSRIEGVRVVARTSSSAFTNSRMDVREIGRRLGTRHVLEGTVRRADDRLKVTAELIDVANGFKVWSETYDRRVEDVFAIQEEISRAIALALTPTLAGAPGAPVVQRPYDAEAYNLYLKGRFHFNLRSIDDARKAVGFFEQAIARDSAFAPAHAGLAAVQALLPYYRAARPTDILARAEAAARRALELDTTLAEAHATLAWINFTYKWDWATAEREFEDALRLNPNHTDALHFYSLYLARVPGRHDRAIALATRAQRLDPLSPVVHTGAGAVYYHARQPERAVAAHRHALAIDSTYSVARYMLAEAYLALGRPADALLELNRITKGEAPSGDRIIALTAYALATLGRRAEAVALRQHAERENVSPVTVAILHEKLGDRDNAFAWLERAADERDPSVIELRHEPMLDPLRSDPRFERIARRIGIP